MASDEERRAAELLLGAPAYSATVELVEAGRMLARAWRQVNPPPPPEPPDWNGIPARDRRLWFGVATKGMEAPWLSGFGACFVKIWDVRRRADGAIEYGIGNETEPPADQIGWVTGDRFCSEWPQ
jgi:hypothetical protein